MSRQISSEDAEERRAWKVIKFKVEKRRKEGKETVVYRHGRLVPAAVLAEKFRKFACSEERHGSSVHAQDDAERNSVPEAIRRMPTSHVHGHGIDSTESFDGPHHRSHAHGSLSKDDSGKQRIRPAGEYCGNSPHPSNRPASSSDCRAPEGRRTLRADEVT